MLRRVKSAIRAIGRPLLAARSMETDSAGHHDCDWPQEVQQRAITIARMLKPSRAVGHRKIRVGGPGDGGYVMLEDFERIATAFSLGVGPNVDWDYDVAERGLLVHQYDHTVDASPRPHDGFRFHKRQITGLKTLGSETLESILDLAADRGPASNLLKIDIENEEWAVFANAPISTISAFSQILCEFHAFEFFHLDWHYETAHAALNNLKTAFEVVHVHGNNSAGMTKIGGRILPYVVEVTLINRDRYETVAARDVFPTAIDTPNDAKKKDYYLGHFDFSGISASGNPL